MIVFLYSVNICPAKYAIDKPQIRIYALFMERASQRRLSAGKVELHEENGSKKL